VWEREGQGWRIAWDSQRSPFPLLIGGEGWASELTATEAQVLCRAVEVVRSQHGALADTLMDEEILCLEFTAPVPAPDRGLEGTLWLTLEGDRQQWILRFVLQPASGQRGLEGFWARGAAEPFAQACAALDGPATLAPDHPAS
jgi:hypothetical protein